MVVNMRRIASQRGLTLIEVLVATAIGAVLLAAINGLVKFGLDAQTEGRNANELAYQGRFALERIAGVARATAPKVLGTPAADTSGDWFAPSGCSGNACIMYCRNAANQLIETTSADTGCTGTTVIATNVSAFSAQLPAGMGPVDRSTGVFSLTMSRGTRTQSFSSSIRLGGGTR
jgi:prepilin-type N-terminal cleavage/methylation domain-containing protein